jgi:hypothetical protein
MFQAYVQSVSVVSDACFKCFHLDVAYVAMAAHVCFKCLFLCVQMLQTYVVKVDLEVAYVAMAIHACLKSICFKCFLRFGLYVANVLFLYFKSRPGVVHVAIYAGG